MINVSCAFCGRKHRERRDDKVLRRAAVGGHEWVHNWKPVERNEFYGDRFCRLSCALGFAIAAHKAGYRIKPK